jgi:hypothetical protein
VIDVGEQLETLPAASVAVAWKVEVVLLDTDTWRPGEAKAAAVPWAETPVVQVELV